MAERILERRALSGRSPCAQQHVGLAGVQAQDVAALDDDALRVERSHQVVVADGTARIAERAPQVDEHAAALQPGFRKPLDAQRRRARERRCRCASARERRADRPAPPR